MLLEAARELPGERIACTSVGWGQLARELAVARPEATVTCTFLDLHRAGRARDVGTDVPNLSVLCEPDLPDARHDLVLLPFPRGGEAELARDLLQQGYARLREGGFLLAATDNKKDSWFQEALKGFPGKAARFPHPGGVVYRLARTAPLKKEKSYRCELAFRHNGRLIQAVTRPGVFAHRRIDQGARALLDVLDVRHGERVLDVGCGCGAAALGAAGDAAKVEVVGIDANARAVACTEEGAAANALDNVTAVLAAADGYAPDAPFDLVVMNAPYFSDYKIAEHFLTLSERATRPGGRAKVVTKQPKWFAYRMAQRFTQVEQTPLRGYTVVSGIARGR